MPFLRKCLAFTVVVSGSCEQMTTKLIPSESRIGDFDAHLQVGVGEQVAG